MEYHYTLNVDTGTFSVFVGLNVGDVVTVYANVPDTTPDENPIGWTLGNSPANGAGHQPLVQTAQNDYVGTITFKAVEPCTGYISYLVSSGPLSGQSNLVNIKVFGTGTVFDVNADGTTTMH